MGMNQTSKRGLNKPDRSDYVSVVSDINENMDNLDDAVPDSRTINGKDLTKDILVGTPTNLSGNNYKLDLRGVWDT